MQKSASDARDTEQVQARGLSALRLRGGGCEALVYLRGAHVAGNVRPAHVVLAAGARHVTESTSWAEPR